MFYQEVMSCHVLPGGHVMSCSTRRSCLGIVLLTNLISCYFTGPRGRFLFAFLNRLVASKVLLSFGTSFHTFPYDGTI